MVDAGDRQAFSGRLPVRLEELEGVDVIPVVPRPIERVPHLDRVHDFLAARARDQQAAALLRVGRLCVRVDVLDGPSSNPDYHALFVTLPSTSKTCASGGEKRSARALRIKN